MITFLKQMALDVAGYILRMDSLQIGIAEIWWGIVVLGNVVLSSESTNYPTHFSSCNAWTNIKNSSKVFRKIIVKERKLYLAIELYS